MIPSPGPNTRCITETALHFVGQRDRSDQLRAGRADAFCDGQRGGNIVARMGRFLRQIGIVVIEIANGTAVREYCPVRWRLMIGTDNCRSSFRRKLRRNLALNPAVLFLPRPERAAYRVTHT